MIDDHTFRRAMGKFATGITVVTTEYDSEITGMTVNAFMSVSLQPKIIAVSIGDQASMYHILQKTKKFGVSILHNGQKDASMIFANQKEDNEQIAYTYQQGIPVLKDHLASIVCHVIKQTVAGDHIVFFGEVLQVSVKDQAPLLYFDSEYHTIQPKPKTSD